MTCRTRSTTTAKADLLATIIEESERLNRFIANLLDMTKLESGAIVPNVAPHDVGEIVGSALRARRAKSWQHHTVEVELATDLPMVRARSGAVRAGAVQSPRQRRQICAAGDDRRASKAGRRAEPSSCRSSTRATAFRPTDLERIFDKFYRAEKGDQVRAGTGLGLAISRGFVEAMGGTIAAANRTDRTGAVFTITLPVPSRPNSWTPPHECSSAQDPGRRRRAADPQAAAHGAGRRKAIRRSRRRTARPPSSCWPDKPDLVILDLGLPDIQGLELLRHDSRSGTKTFRSSCSRAAATRPAKVEALDHGADDYVTKPFGMDELLARMRAALRHQLQMQGERPIFQVGDLSVDLVRRIVKIGGKEVKLSPKEYDLLRLLVQHAGKVLTHKFLLNELWRRSGRPAISARLRPAAPAEDRDRPRAAAIHFDRNRHRLSVAGAGLTCRQGPCA